MRHVFAFSVMAILTGSSLMAQSTTFAEELVKVKLGRYPASVEQRRNQQKSAQEAQAAKQQLQDLFAKLDTDRDGKISTDEWSVLEAAGRTR